MHCRLFMFLLLLVSTRASAQYPRFSLGTDIGIVHNFRKEQRFTVLNHTVHADFHLVQRDGIRVSFGYCSNAKFDNKVSATAKSGSTTPQQLTYTNNSNLRFRQLSIGWKHYFIGEAAAEKGWNLYGCAAFGLMLGRVTNNSNTVIDTSRYTLALQQGTGHFKRLSYDLSLGWEKPIGADISFYTEARLYIPSTDYPSSFLLVNRNAPYAGILCGGLRILF